MREAVAGIGRAPRPVHVGNGRGPGERTLLRGLGVVHAVALAQVRNLLVRRPLLTPLGGSSAYLSGGDIRRPWAAVLGFADVLAVVAAAIVPAVRRERRRARARQADGPPR